MVIEKYGNGPVQIMNFGPQYNIACILYYYIQECRQLSPEFISEYSEHDECNIVT